MAHYEYSPYGEVIVAVGAEAFSNPFRFSTKYWDTETGLGYWGYRYYDAETGRWLSRDPVGERGSVNRYTVVGERQLHFRTDDNYTSASARDV